MERWCKCSVETEPSSSVLRCGSTIQVGSKSRAPLSPAGSAFILSSSLLVKLCVQVIQLSVHYLSYFIQ